MSEIVSPIDTAGPRVGRQGGTFWLVVRRELIDLWVSGRMLVLVLLFTVLMSLTSISRQVESQVNLIPPPEMVFLTLLSAISFGMLLSLVVGADSISGDRERGTLEPMLLSPLGRRRIVLAKFIAALSPWPVALLLSLPYVIVLAQGDALLIPGLAWTVALGTLLAMAFSSFAILVSLWSRSNRTSLFVCLFVYLLFLIPTQFPGQAQKGGLGYAIQQVDPMQATSEFLEKFIVNNRQPSERYTYLISTVGTAAFFVVLLFGYAAPRLALEGGSPGIRRGAKPAAKAGAATLAAVALALGGPGAGRATAADASAAPATVETSPITIDIDKDAEVINTGDEIKFSTTVTNTGATASPELVVAMNIINLGKSDPVDPEDWSPQRTQAVDSLEPGKTAQQSWSVEGVLDGNYMVYMTAIVKPSAPAETSLPVTSPGIHLTVRPFQDTNPGGVLPVAIGMPLGLIAVAYFLRRYWRRERGPASGGAAA
jgi:ABC-type transport system involved in cytochrome c biogenesis permease component